MLNRNSIPKPTPIFAKYANCLEAFRRRKHLNFATAKEIPQRKTESSFVFNKYRQSRNLFLSQFKFE